MSTQGLNPPVYHLSQIWLPPLTSPPPLPLPTCDQLCLMRREHAVPSMVLSLSHHVGHVVWPVGWCRLEVPLVAS